MLAGIGMVGGAAHLRIHVAKARVTVTDLWTGAPMTVTPAAGAT